MCFGVAGYSAVKPLEVFIWETFLIGILQTSGKCYICLREGYNMPRTACCKQLRHKKCERRFRRTLASYTKACGYCRKAFKDPCATLPEEIMDDTMALYKRDVSKDTSQWFVTVEIWLEIKLEITVGIITGLSLKRFVQVKSSKIMCDSLSL